MNNTGRNRAEIRRFRNELKRMLGDISEIDKRILNRVGNKTVRRLKEDTPVNTGFMRRSWKADPAVQYGNKTEKVIVNTADYASYVNDGHRIVRNGATVGFVEGHFMLERALSQAERDLVTEFEAEVRRVNREHGD